MPPPPAPPRFISCEQIVFLQTLVSSIRHTLWLKLCIMSTLLIHRLWIIMTYYDYEWLWNSATFIQIGKCLKLKAQDDACQAATGLLPRWKKKEVTRVAPTMKHHATRTGWNKLKRKPRSHAGSQLYGGNWLEEPSLKHTLDYTWNLSGKEKDYKGLEMDGIRERTTRSRVWCDAGWASHLSALQIRVSRNAETQSFNVFYAFALRVRKCAFLAYNYRTCCAHDFDSHHLH